MREQFSLKMTKKEVKILSLGDFLRQIRMSHNLTQEEMGNLFYRNKDYIYKVESGKIVPTMKELEIISKKLKEPVVLLVMYGISIQQLLER